MQPLLEESRRNEHPNLSLLLPSHSFWCHLWAQPVGNQMVPSAKVRPPTHRIRKTEGQGAHNSERITI